MPTMLDLPREIYLEFCAYLSPTDLAKLAGASRDHNLATRQPLYSRITITAYSSFIKLVDTLRKVPVVSHISPSQRVKWFKLSDAQLCERDIKHLDLTLDFRKDGKKITGAILANCMGAIGRKCYTVQITLTLNAMPADFVKQMDRFGLSSVRRLKIFLASSVSGPVYDSHDAPAKVWDLVFSGTGFPDVKSVYINTNNNSKDEEPTRPFTSVGSASNDAHSYDEHPTGQPADTTMPFYGLRKMEEIILAHNNYLDVPTLEALFGSDIIPSRLTRLEIVDCPNLHPVKHLTALSTLLQRALSLVQHLKLHLCRLAHFDEEETFLDTQYAARINDHPEEHLCNIIRELGQNTKSLDLAVPFACDRMFPHSTTLSRVADLPVPTISLQPMSTMPDRVSKSRRVIGWHGVCRRAHRWGDMTPPTDTTGNEVSWILLYPPEDHGTWHLSGCAPVRFSANIAMTARFAKAGP